MNVVIWIILIIGILWILGKVKWSIQDSKNQKNTPNHPSNISKKTFPIGSGSCPINRDRHIWIYEPEDDKFGPTRRNCKYCGKSEFRLLTKEGWREY